MESLHSMLHSITRTGLPSQWEYTSAPKEGEEWMSKAGLNCLVSNFLLSRGKTIGIIHSNLYHMLDHQSLVSPLFSLQIFCSPRVSLPGIYLLVASRNWVCAPNLKEYQLSLQYSDITSLFFVNCIRNRKISQKQYNARGQTNSSWASTTLLRTVKFIAHKMGAFFPLHHSQNCLSWFFSQEICSSFLSLQTRENSLPIIHWGRENILL